MSISLELLIRDGVESDLASCLNLDTTYETNYVWQMSIFQDTGEHRIAFKLDRLPRTLQANYEVNIRKLRLVLSADHCFIVATRKEEPEQIIAFLTMRLDSFHQRAIVQDIVVSPEFRRRKIGTRLLKVARRWALERQAVQFILETQTKNFPSIAFCQQQGLPFCGYSDQHFQNHDIAVYFGQALR